MSAVWPWVTLVLLGVYHGANPGMGWLFAVALGLQEKSGRAVLRALVPIAVGHAASVGLAVALLAMGKASLDTRILTWATAALVIGFGVFKLVRPRHPRWVGMRVTSRDLLLWSFLMATAHGAGLMLLPVFLLGEDNAAPCHGATCHSAAGLSLSTWSGYVAAVGLHTLAMLGAAAAIALVVYYKFGLSLLRKAWVNLDRIWAAALILAGIVALVV
jgi:hypothetical protein